MMNSARDRNHNYGNNNNNNNNGMMPPPPPPAGSESGIIRGNSRFQRYQQQHTGDVQAPPPQEQAATNGQRKFANLYYGNSPGLREEKYAALDYDYTSRPRCSRGPSGWDVVGTDDDTKYVTSYITSFSQFFDALKDRRDHSNIPAGVDITNMDATQMANLRRETQNDGIDQETEEIVLKLLPDSIRKALQENTTIDTTNWKAASHNTCSGFEDMSGLQDSTYDPSGGMLEDGTLAPQQQQLTLQQQQQSAAALRNEELTLSHINSMLQRGPILKPQKAPFPEQTSTGAKPRCYVAGLPPQLPSEEAIEQLRHIVYQEMFNLEGRTLPPQVQPYTIDNAITHIFPHNNYVFMEFSTFRDAEAALSLDGLVVKFYGEKVDINPDGTVFIQNTDGTLTPVHIPNPNSNNESIDREEKRIVYLQRLNVRQPKDLQMHYQANPPRKFAHPDKKEGSEAEYLMQQQQQAQQQYIASVLPQGANGQNNNNNNNNNNGALSYNNGQMNNLQDNNNNNGQFGGQNNNNNYPYHQNNGNTGGFGSGMTSVPSTMILGGHPGGGVPPRPPGLHHKQQQQDKGPEWKVYIGNIPNTITQDDLHDVFKAVTGLRGFNFVQQPHASANTSAIPQQQQQAKVYAFASYDTIEHAEEAILRFNNLPVSGRHLVVKFTQQGLALLKAMAERGEYHGRALEGYMQADGTIDTQQRFPGSNNNNNGQYDGNNNYQQNQQQQSNSTSTMPYQQQQQQSQAYNPYVQQNTAITVDGKRIPFSLLPTEYLLFYNVASFSEFQGEDKEDILLDIMDVCHDRPDCRYITAPADTGAPTDVCIFVHLDDPLKAAEVRTKLSGKKFGSRIVEVQFVESTIYSSIPNHFQP